MPGICRPDGAGDLFGFGFYKDAAPTALGGLARGRRPIAHGRAFGFDWEGVLAAAAEFARIGYKKLRIYACKMCALPIQ